MSESADVGVAGPFLMMLGFIPMGLVVSAFYYWNKCDPDCGETFIWAARAFGARIGWVVGFTAVSSAVMVMATLVQGFRMGNEPGSVESAAGWHGVGGVFLIPVGTLCVGVVLALVLAVLKPGFFGRPAETWQGEGVALPYENERIVE